MASFVKEWLRCMQLVKCCTSNYSKRLYGYMNIAIKKIKRHETEEDEAAKWTIHACTVKFWLHESPAARARVFTPHAENEYQIPWAHNNLKLIETFIITRKQNFHQRIYKRQRNTEPYNDLFPSNSHLLVEDCLVIVIWTTAHFCIGFLICLFPRKSSTKILLYTLTMHETDSPRLILPYLITTITLGECRALRNLSLCN